MIALFGHPPKQPLDGEREALNWKWKHPLENSKGRMCTSVDDYFGGPFFDSDGKHFRDYISVHMTELTTSKASSYIKSLFAAMFLYRTALHLYKGKKSSCF